MVSGLSIRTASDINGYTIGTMGFKGTLHGVEVELNGTVEVRIILLPNQTSYMVKTDGV